MYVRGAKEDYDAWSAQGNEGWGWNDGVEAAFKRVEGHAKGSVDDGLFGTEGPVKISETRYRTPLCDAFIQGIADVCGKAEKLELK